MKAHVSMDIMITPRVQSHTKANVDRPTKSNTPDSTYRRHTSPNSTAGVRKALKRFFDFYSKEKNR